MSVFLPSSVRVLNDVPVPMRDGVRSRPTSIFPTTGSGPWPVLLARTPYDNNLLMDLGLLLGAARLCLCRAGCARPVRLRRRVCPLGPRDGRRLRHPGMDRAATLVRWEHRHDGGSYLGQVQWQAAITGHPLLKTIVPRVMGNNLWDSPHYQGGAFGLGVNAVWGWRTMGRTMQRIDRIDWPAVLRTLPLRAMETSPASASRLCHLAGSSRL